MSRLSPDWEIDKAAMENEFKGSDRSVCIIVAAMVERILERLLLFRLDIKRNNPNIEKLFDRDGALSSFYGNIHFAHILGIINEADKDKFETIRRSEMLLPMPHCQYLSKHQKLSPR